MEYLIIFLQYVLARVALRILKAPYHPVVILCQLWLVISICTGVFAPDYYYSPMAYMLILSMQVSAVLGALAYFLVSSDQANVSRPEPQEFLHFRPIVYGSLFFGLVAIASILRTQGISVTKLFSFSGIMEISHAMSIARYEEQFQLPLGARVAQMFIFFATTIGGLFKSLYPDRYRRFEYYIPIIPSLLIAIILTTRAAVLFNLIFWVAGNFCGAILGGGRVNLRLLSKKVVLYGSVGAILVAFMFISLQFMRGGITDLGRLKEVLMHLRQWPVGSIAGFSLWVDAYDFRSAVTNGYLTFVGIFDLFGIQARKAGLYDQYVNLGGGDSWGNIYTAFRGLIQDFSLPGAMMYMATIGFLSSVAFRRCVRGEVVWAALLVAMYGFVFWTPIVSLFSYTAHIGAYVGLAIYFRFFGRRRRLVKPARELA
ncbi:O-antigen polymerase [Paraburkholderia sp. J94]|uniref:O-antigen polymerase n=1 Tax=Paraburkholderia sp. J94 TaxID=2805441 RepID=UPI002AAFBB83|nr:O-antigen polymerase [Paraburkholderia sp. J94]